MGIRVCNICGAPDAHPFRHQISAAESHRIGPVPCSICGLASQVTCVLGIGDLAYVCPQGHRSGTITARDSMSIASVDAMLHKLPDGALTIRIVRQTAQGNLVHSDHGHYRDGDRERDQANLIAVRAVDMLRDRLRARQSAGDADVQRMYEAAHRSVFS